MNRRITWTTTAKQSGRGKLFVRRVQGRRAVPPQRAWLRTVASLTSKAIISAKPYIGIAAAGGNGIRNSPTAKFPRAGFEGQNLTRRARFLPPQPASGNNQYPNSLWFRHWDIWCVMRNILKTIRGRSVHQLIRIVP